MDKLLEKILESGDYDGIVDVIHLDIAEAIIRDHMEGHTLVPTKILADLLSGHYQGEVDWTAFRELEDVLNKQEGEG